MNGVCPTLSSPVFHLVASLLHWSYASNPTYCESLCATGQGHLNNAASQQSSTLSGALSLLSPSRRIPVHAKEGMQHRCPI